MATELFIAALIMVPAVLLVELLLIVIKAVKIEPGKPGNTSKDRRVSWWSSCYEPCIKDPDNSALILVS